MINMVKLPTKKSNLFLRVAKGHFATSHSHINYYIDVTTQKSRLSEAKAVAKELVAAYQHSTIVDTVLCLDGTQVIGTRHGEKLFETLMTREERLRSEDMGGYYRVAADNRDLNYDKFVVKGEVHTMADDSYTSHNTNRLDVEGTVKKILTTEYVRNALKEMEAEKKA